MEKAILKTLAYSDIFDYPLTLYEIHKWLIGRKANLREVEEALVLLMKKATVKRKNQYYFLPRRESLVNIRKRREKQSVKYFNKAKQLAAALRLIPDVKLVGISGGLAMNNAQKSDDIDLFIITKKGRLWISRLLVLGLLSLAGQRRKFGEGGRAVAGKICVNTILEEDRLTQETRDIYTAHEVLQMKVLWERGGIYQKYLEDNLWVFKYIPNWVGESRQISASKYRVFDNITWAESLAEKFQLWYMKQPQGMERILEGALYFHPNDYREKVLKRYKKRIARFNSGTP